VIYELTQKIRGTLNTHDFLFSLIAVSECEPIEPTVCKTNGFHSRAATVYLWQLCRVQTCSSSARKGTILRYVDAAVMFFWVDCLS
jgi:hypothetical protein